MEYSAVLDLLRLSLTGEISDEYCSSHPELLSSVDWNELYAFLSGHTVSTLFYDLNKYVPDDLDVKKEWRDTAFRNISYYYRLIDQQNQILEKLQTEQIPVAVLKGSSAAKYYPLPHLREMGDIDLLVKPEDYDRAVRCLLDNGCTETTSQSEMERGRHRSFTYNNIPIELHRYFSKYMDSDKSNELEELLHNAISNNGTELPDEENGIVLLSHIRQHLEEGLGLRQIFDWMMYVKSCLYDEQWYSSFRFKAQKTGLETLAVAVTKMCQQYLGLTDDIILWCKGADETVCDELMQYVIECGNFGRKRELFKSGSVSRVPSIKHPVQLFKFLQLHGEQCWKMLKKHPVLKPFAWIYQLCRYIKMAVKSRVGVKKIKEIYSEGSKRNEMFIALGIKQSEQ